MNRTETFFALQSGHPEGTQYTQAVHALGDLVVPSGFVEASDPFVSLGDQNAYAVPAGSFPVFVTVADVSEQQDGSHLREAYLSVVFADGEVARVAPAVPDGKEAPAAGSDEAYGIGVDAGTVGFADARAITTSMPEGNWYEDLFDNDTDTSWFALMDSPDHLIAGCANIPMPLARNGENVVLAHSGWGDGWYPVLATYDASGTLLGLHIDLLVAGPTDESDGDDD